MESYMEYMVKKETTGKDKAVRALCYIVIALMAVAAFLTMQPILFVAALIFGMLYRYFIYPMTDLEYEYM